MPTTGLFARKVDPVIESTLKGYSSYFTKPEVVKGILNSAPALNNVIKQADLHAPGWGLGGVLMHAVEGRVTQQLQKTVYSKKHGTKLRIYENYAVGHGPRRWQKLEVMSMSELDVCLQWRKAHVASEQAVIAAYERILDQMKQLNMTKVGDIL